MKVANACAWVKKYVSRDVRNGMLLQSFFLIPRPHSVKFGWMTRSVRTNNTERRSPILEGLASVFRIREAALSAGLDHRKQRATPHEFPS
jgi:hypothetical protein